MIFGYVWKDPRAIDEKAQRQYLADAAATDRSTRIEKSPAREWRSDLIEGDKPLMRAGDVLAVYRTRYLADDSLDFVRVVCRLAALKCGLLVINQGVTVWPEREVSDLIEQDIAERRKKQTANAREEWKKLPKSKRGGAIPVEQKWTDEQRKKFRKLWAMSPAKCSLRDIAGEFDIKAPTVSAVAARMKLPPRGGAD